MKSKIAKVLLLSLVFVLLFGTVQAFAETPTAVKDAEGTIRIPAGAGMPASETLTGMDWFMQGITVIDTGA